MQIRIQKSATAVETQKTLKDILPFYAPHNKFKHLVTDKGTIDQKKKRDRQTDEPNNPTPPIKPQKHIWITQCSFSLSLSLSLTLTFFQFLKTLKVLEFLTYKQSRCCFCFRGSKIKQDQKIELKRNWTGFSSFKFCSTIFNNYPYFTWSQTINILLFSFLFYWNS